MPSYAEHILDIYGIRLILTRNGREWAAARKALAPTLGPTPRNPTTTRMQWDNGHVEIYFYIPEDDEAGQHINNLAHEATHCASFIFEMINTPETESREPFAYLVGWITAWLHQHTQETS